MPSSVLLTVVSDVQPEKVVLGSASMSAEMVAEVSCAQPENTLAPSDVTDAGTVTVVSAVSKNALAPMVVTDEGMDTLASPLCEKGARADRLQACGEPRLR